MPSPLTQAEIDADLFEMLEDLAQANEACPPGIKLSQRLGVTRPGLQLAFARLREAGLIDWRLAGGGQGDGRRRVVTICATGQSTQMPPYLAGGAGEGYRHDLVLEEAKTELRRTGRVVYDAEVVDGERGRGLVKVDHCRLPRLSVIALARKLSARFDS